MLGLAGVVGRRRRRWGWWRRPGLAEWWRRPVPVVVEVEDVERQAGDEQE
jgi:hypothetical protein